ncbi:acyltransferase domain-containing protein [Streptomyces sp. S3(2020)]|uniref:ACP S-malonyltransferase n=1 Tax=Streptomyces sp. S3(2020) TaxID=2732044 RepID=UPI0014885034|nr:acyltransferase domain-containing protein [Streptomyces sp. S3(2020)]NNN36017.1 acyltransferase domain-containing protein [Streptomyces sp. S3(2020)]
MRTRPSPTPQPWPSWRRTVHLFPGQGDFSVGSLIRAAQAGGMLAAVREVFEQIDEVAVERGLRPLSPWLLGQRPPSGRELAQAATGTAQLALFGASVAVHQALCASYGVPSAVVGVSFGEIAALTAAKVLTVGDGARVAHDLAVVLASCPGGLSLLGCSEQSARRLLEGAGAPDAVVAVVNDDRSVVVAGPVQALARIEKVAGDVGVSAVRLRLPFSSHHLALADQAEVFATSVRAYPLAEARVPVYSAVAGRRYRPDDDLPRRLADCLVRPAVVPTVLRQAALHRPDVFFEAGTGHALTVSARRVLAASPVAPPVHAPLAEPDFPW